MLFLENLKPLKIYKKPLYLPTVEGDKKKNSAIFLLTPNYPSSKGIMTSNLLINKLRFASYYIEKDTTFFIGKKAMEEVEDVTETYVHNMTQYDLYQSLYEMSAAERNSLEDSDFGLPEKRKYPLDSIAHIKSAIKFFNYVDKEDEKELADNINKAVKKYNLKVNIGSKNRLSNYINESVLTESWIFNKDNVEYNLDKFKSGKSNILLITGLSGSGKSTLGEKYAKEYKTEFIELDIFEHCYGYSDDNIKEAGEVFYDYLSSHKDLWDKLKKKEIKGKELGKEIDKFVHYCISWCSKHKETKWVIEGVQIYSFMKSDEVKDYPMIILGTSMKNSILQRFKRNAGGGKIEWKEELSNEFPQLLRWYWDEEKSLSSFKKSLTESNIVVRHIYDLTKNELDGNKVDINDSDNFCPVKLSNIPNYMGINLCSVHSVEWSETLDGQLIDIIVKFIPDDGKEIEEAYLLESKQTLSLSKFKAINNPSKDFVEDHINDAEYIKDFLSDKVRKNSCFFIDTKTNKVACVFMVFNDGGHHIINNLEVVKSYRGTGLSTQLLDFAVTKKNADHLWVDDDNTIARHLYEKYGFKYTGDKYEEDDHTRLYMELDKSVNEANTNDPYNNPILEKEWGFTHVDGLYHALVRVEGIDKNLRGRAEMLVLDPSMTKVYLVFDKDGKDYKIPGGGFNYNESHLESAYRETIEESRIETVGIYDTGVRYVKMYEDDPAVRQKEFAEENRFYGAYTEVFIGTYAQDYWPKDINTLDVDFEMTKGHFYPIEEVYDKLKPYHQKALNSSIKESTSVVIETQANLSNLTCYHLDLGRKGKNPKDIGSPWDEELYSKNINTAIINDICGSPKDIIRDAIKKRDKIEVNVYTHGEDLTAIYLGKLSIFFYDITSGSNPDRIYKYGNPKGSPFSFDWEWAEQEEISQELMDYYKEEVWKESVSEESLNAKYSVSANIIKNGKMLLEYNSKHGYYTLPGGKQNGNETLVETLVRELKEELNISITEMGNLHCLTSYETEFPKGSGNIRTFTDYNIDILGYTGEITNMESESCSNLVWMSLEEMENIPKSEILIHVRNHFLNEASVIDQSNNMIDLEDKLQNCITCSGYSKDLAWLKEIATPELYFDLLEALDLSIDDFETLPTINFIGGDSENLEIDTNKNMIDVYCYSPVCASNVNKSGYVKYAIKASIVGLIVSKCPNLAGTVIPMCIAEALLGATEGWAKFALRMIAKYTMRGLFKKITGMTTTEFFKMGKCKSEDLDKIEDLEEFVSESAPIVASASKLSKNLKYKNSTKTKTQIGKLRNKASKLSKDIKDSVHVDTPKPVMSPKGNDVSTEAVISSLAEGFYIINGDYVSIFTEDAANDPYLRKIFYTERIKKRSEILELLDRAKREIPDIKYAYPDLDRYAGKNLFIDLYYFNECFFKNNTLNVVRSYGLYQDLLDRLINDKRFNNYTRKTVFIPINDWYKNPNTRMWYYKEDLNPISLIYQMMYKTPQILKKIFKNTSIVFFDKDKYFTIDTNNITKQDLNRFKMFITKINKNEEFDSSDVDSDEKQSPESIKTDIMDKIEISKGVDLTKAKVDIDKEKKSRPNGDIINPTLGEAPAKKKDDKESEDEKLKDIARSIDFNVDASNPIDTDDALDALDKDPEFKELILGLDSMKDDVVNISAARSERMNELDRQLLDKSLKNRSIREILDDNKDSTKELPTTELNLATPNEEWKNLQYINYDKSYDIDADLVKVFNSLSKMSHPMSIVEIKADDNSTSEDALFLYTVTYEDYRGKRYTLKLDIPKINKNRFLLRGNAKTIQTQFFNMPILKTDLDTAQVVTNYKKIIVSRYNTSSGKSLPNTARLIKALSKYSGRKIKISTGDNSRVCNKYDLTIDYIDLASVFSEIETDNYIFYFDQDSINSKYDNVNYDKGFPFAYDKKKKTLLYYLNKDTTPFVDRMTDLLFENGDNKELNELFIDAKPPTRMMYSRARIMGSDIPLVIVCAYSEGLTKVLNKANIEYKLVDKLTSEQKRDFNYDFIKFNDGFIYYKVDYCSSLLLNGLNDVDTLSHSITEIDDRNMYLEFLDGYGGRIKADGLDNFYDCEIDPITEETLKFYNLPTDYISVLLYTNYLLADNKFFRHTDTASRRARRFELVAAYTYQVITEAYGTYANSIKHNRNQVPFSCKQSAVIDKILLDPTSSDYSVINVLNDVETTNAISTKGLSGMNSDRSYSLDKRTYDQSMVNVLGMSTGFSGNVGITRQATINMAIEGKRGYVKDNKGNTESMNTANTLTATEALVPLSTTHDDTMRVAMTFIQTCKHAVRTAESDPLLVTNGADEALPYICSDQFAHKSKGEGIVKELTDEYMIVEYKDGNKEYINLTQTIEKNSDGGFYVTLKLDADPKLKEGSKIKPNQILAWDIQSMSNSLGESDNLAYNTGKLAKIAIINTEEGFEDSGICTEEIAEKLACKITNKRDCILDKNTNIFNVAKVGSKVEQGDTLMVWQTPYDEEEVNILLKTLAGDKEAVSELGKHTIKSEYTGTLVGVKIYRTVKDDELSDSLKKLVKQYEKPISELRKKLKEENIDVSGLPANYPLEATGKLKGAADGVLIEFYVEYYDKLGIGDKITYNAANKAVIKNIIPKGKEPYTDLRPNEHISAFVSVTSIDKRMVTSTMSYGALQKLMVELDRTCKDIAGIPYDDSIV